MIKRWFKDTFEVYRKVYSDEFNNEPYVLTGQVKGFLQLSGGRFGGTNKKMASEVSALMYCDMSVDIAAGDRVKDKYGVFYLVHFVQGIGISGIGDHQELTLEKIV